MSDTGIYKPTIFIKKWNGKAIDVDGYQKDDPYQCVDLWDEFCQEIGEKVQLVEWAKDIANQKFEKIKDTKSPVLGDWVIFGEGGDTPKSHVAMYIHENSDGSIKCFGQNQGEPLCNMASINAPVLKYLHVKDEYWGEDQNGYATPTGKDDCDILREYCNDCDELKDESSEFYLNGVTDNVCKSLNDNTGFNKDNGNDNCHDMHIADSCLIKNLHDLIDAYDVCDWKDFTDMFVTNQYNMNEAMICWLCGMEARFFTMNLTVEFQSTVQQATPQLNVSIDRKGNFVYSYHDWNSGTSPWTDLGNGVLTGKVDYCVKSTENQTALFNIKGIKINNYKFTRTSNAYPDSSRPIVTIKVPDKNGTSILKKQVGSTFSMDINKYVEINQTVSVPSGQKSNWINVLWWYDDWTADDEFNLQIRFGNNNIMPMPTCND
jgi:hypothetical protein